LLDHAALREWQAEVFSYQKSGNSFILQTSCGSRRLFICEKEKQALNVQRIAEHLTANGFLCIPRPVKNRFGEFIVPAYNGYYYITDAFCGESLAYESEEECIKAAAFLGAFHKAAKGFAADKMPSLSFAGQKIALRLLQLQSFACISLQTEELFSYLLQSCAEALTSFSPQKEAKLQKLYRRGGGFNLGGQTELLCIENETLFIRDLSSCKAGGGICDLSEILLKIAAKENYLGHNSLQALKAYNRENKLEREELDLLLAVLLLPAVPLGILNKYLRGEYQQTVMLEKFSAACEEEKLKNRWVKRLLL